MQTFTLIPEFEYPEEENFKTQQTPFSAGYVQTRAYWPYPKRIFRLRWDAALLSEKEYAVSFFRSIQGPAGAFLYTPQDPISSPHYPGDPSQVSGGALANRTYSYALSWRTAFGETSITSELTYAITAGYLFKLTVPRFHYRSIVTAAIYCKIASVWNFQSTVAISNGTWTEPTGGLQSGTQPLSRSTGYEQIQVHLMNDSFVWTKRTALSYGMEMAFEELF